MRIFIMTTANNKYSNDPLEDLPKIIVLLAGRSAQL